MRLRLPRDHASPSNLAAVAEVMSAKGGGAGPGHRPHVGRARYPLTDRPPADPRTGVEQLRSALAIRCRSITGRSSPWAREDRDPNAGRSRRARRSRSEPGSGLVTRSEASPALDTPGRPGFRPPGRHGKNPGRGGWASSGEVRAKRDRRGAPVGRARREKAWCHTRAEAGAENDPLSPGGPRAARERWAWASGRALRPRGTSARGGPPKRWVTMAKKRSGELDEGPTPRS